MAIWTDKFIRVNEYARSGQKLTAVKKIVMHYTANNGATAMNHYNYFNNLSERYASAHFFVDKVEALCIIPLNEVAYHANDVQKRNADGSAWRGISALLPNANYLSIGIELCVEKDGTFHADTIKRAEDVAVELCKRYGLNPLTDIVRHRDVTYKNCPAPWVSNPSAFETFKKNVSTKKAGDTQPAPTPTAPTTGGAIIGKVKVIIEGLNIRTGNGTNYPVKEQAVYNQTYNVTANINDWHEIIVRDGEKGWVFGNNGQYLALVREDEPIGTTTVVATALNIRNAPSTSGADIGTAVQGAKFPVYEVHNGWYRISKDGKWIYSANGEYATRV